MIMTTRITMKITTMMTKIDKTDKEKDGQIMDLRMPAGYLWISGITPNSFGIFVVSRGVPVTTLNLLRYVSK